MLGDAALAAVVRLAPTHRLHEIDDGELGRALRRVSHLQEQLHGERLRRAVADEIHMNVDGLRTRGRTPPRKT